MWLHPSQAYASGHVPVARQDPPSHTRGSPSCPPDSVSLWTPFRREGRTSLQSSQKQESGGRQDVPSLQAPGVVVSLVLVVTGDVSIHPSPAVRGTYGVVRVVKLSGVRDMDVHRGPLDTPVGRVVVTAVTYGPHHPTRGGTPTVTSCVSTRSTVDPRASFGRSARDPQSRTPSTRPVPHRTYPPPPPGVVPTPRVRDG